MYTREDEDQARRLWKKRLGLALVPMIVGLAAGITLFVVGQMRRSDTLWMATAALTVLGGGAFLFLFGVWAKPALDYLSALSGEAGAEMCVLTSNVPVTAIANYAADCGARHVIMGGGGQACGIAETLSQLLPGVRVMILERE